MGKYSDDPAVEEAVLAAEGDYRAAAEAIEANPGDDGLIADYKDKKKAFANARQASRAGRTGFGITAEGELA